MLAIQKFCAQPSVTPPPFQKFSNGAEESSILMLPVELIHSILLWLPAQNTHACSLTNRVFSQITQQEGLWKQLYIRDFSFRYGTENPPSTYFNAYTNAHRLGFNVQREIYSSKVLSIWDNIFDSVKCMHSCNEKLFLGCFGGDLIIKNSITGVILKKIAGEGDTPQALDTSGGVLYVGYSSGSVKAWDTETGQCLKTFKENIHNGTALSLISSEGKLIVSFANHTINIWDTQSNHLIKTLNKDRKVPIFHVHTLAVYKNHLFAGDQLGKSMIWNMETWDEVSNRLCIDEFTKIHFTPPNEKGVLAYFNFFDVFRTACCKNVLIISELGTNQYKSFKGHEDHILLLTVVKDRKLPINLDGKFIFEERNHIRAWNYDVDQKDVMHEIVDQFRSRNLREIADAECRFLRMPPKAKNKVYMTLCREIYDPSRLTLNRYPNSDIHLQNLYRLVWEKSSPEEKARVIIDCYPRLSQEQQWEGPSRCAKKQKT